MKKQIFIGLLSIFGITLSSCGGGTTSSIDDSQSSESIHTHADTNNDHYCDECNERISYCKDDDINGVCDVCNKSWSNQTKQLFNNTIGELLPYFEVTTDFTQTTYGYLEALVDGDVRDIIDDCFTSTGKYTSEETSYLDSPALLLYKASDSSEQYNIRVYVIYNPGTDISYVDVDTVVRDMDKFPLEQVNNYLDNKPLCNIIVPDDGTIFSYEENEYCCTVYYNGDGAKYLQKLIDANYIIDTSMMEYYPYRYTFRAISSDRTLTMEIGVSAVENTNAKTILKFSYSEVPNEVDWSEEAKEIMMDLIEEVIPFANAGFTFDIEENRESATYHNYMTATSYNIDAFVYAVNAFVANEDYEGTYTEDGGFYTFTKDKGTFIVIVVISVYESETTIAIERKIPSSTTWPSQRILDCFDIEIDDVIPSSEGTLFKVYYEKAHPNIALVTVVGSKDNLDNYIQSLEDANYVIKSDPISDYAAIAPNKTITMYITDYTDATGQEAGYKPFFTIEIQASEKKQEEAIFPIEEINAELGQADATYDGPNPTGTSFTTSYPYGKGVGACDILVSITGGDREAFINALIAANYLFDSDNSYIDYQAYSNPSKHITVYVYLTGTNSDYDIEFGLYFSW